MTKSSTVAKDECCVPEKNECQNFEDGPLVVVPDDVADALQRVQEPHEGRVWSTGKQIGHLSESVFLFILTWV